MEQKPGQKKSLYDNLAVFSIAAGLFALSSCCSPPVQLVFGAAAVMLSWLSKNGKPMAVPAVIGMVMGIVSIVLSILIFIQYIWAMDLMADPNNVSMVKEVFRQSQDVLNQLLGTPVE